MWPEVLSGLVIVVLESRPASSGKRVKYWVLKSFIDNAVSSQRRFVTELIFGLNTALNKESAAPQAVHQSSISAAK